jgi:hypothetical protein
MRCSEQLLGQDADEHPVKACDILMDEAVIVRGANGQIKQAHRAAPHRVRVLKSWMGERLQEQLD